MDKFLKDLEEFPVIESPLKKRYRNNILFSIGFNEKDEIEIGPMIEGKKVLNSKSNELVSELCIKVCECVKEYIIKFSEIPVVRYPILEGCWRHIHIKENFEKQYIICFRLQNFAKYQPKIENELNKLVIYIQKNIHEELMGLYYQVTNKLREPTIHDKLYQIYKKDDLIKVILDKKFILHPLTFFQVNFGAAEKMYLELDKIIKEKVSCEPDKKFILYDLYCGIGVYSILFHKYFEKCIGIDNNPNNIKIANKLKEINNIKNIEFIEKNIKDYNSTSTLRSIIIINPNRKGLNKENINNLKNVCNKIFLIVIYCDKKNLIKNNKLLNLNLRKKIEMFPSINKYEYIISNKIIK
tara:strand:+ start:2473 stop:3534 length:1062 start_codon:yes stop_codon:yes gene_type:complete